MRIFSFLVGLASVGLLACGEEDDGDTGEDATASFSNGTSTGDTFTEDGPVIITVSCESYDDYALPVHVTVTPYDLNGSVAQQYVVESSDAQEVDIGLDLSARGAVQLKARCQSKDGGTLGTGTAWVCRPEYENCG